MANKKVKRVKNKRPMAGWALWLLKFTQHITVCLAMLCVAAIILGGTVYIEQYGGYRVALSFSPESNERKAQLYLEERLVRVDLGNIIQLATIRSQLETDGKFDLKKEINISEYYYRKDPQNKAFKEMYFEKAVYELEDLLRWQQSGGLQYLDSAVNWNIIGDARVYQPVQESSIVYNVNPVVNMFLTVDGLRLEQLVDDEEEYSELCTQLASCMSQLNTNYQQYQSNMKRYMEGNTSFVYYIQMDNEAGDIYTNREELLTLNKNDLEKYFDGMACSAAGTTALYYDIQGDYEVNQNGVLQFIRDYDYAFGNAAAVYAGYDMSLGIEDQYSAVWDAYTHYDTESMYTNLFILSGCVLYYVFVMLYLIYASGRKVDRDGEEFIELQWNDSVYTELFLGWCVVLGFGITLLSCVFYEHFYYSSDNYISLVAAVIIVAGSFILSIFVTEAMCSLARRVKAGTLLKNSLLYKIFWVQLLRFGRFLKRKRSELHKRMQCYVEHSGLWEKTWGILLVEVVFYFLCLVLVCYFVRINEYLCTFVAGAVMIFVMVIASFKRMKGRMERREIIEKIEGIVAGEDVRVEEEHLSSENLTLGHAVNEIGEGIRAAVEKSVKDERLKGELLTNVSHDIKTPLTSIINYVDLLKKEDLKNEKASEYIEVLEKKALKLKNLIQDLMEVSKISTGNIEYEMMPINLHELVLQATGEYDEKFAEHCLKLIYNNDAKDAVIMADSRRIWRVMENLLSNVYKYALEGTRVYVEVTGNEEEVTFTMKNISAKEINIQVDELTERFVRGDSSRTTEGNGLGLAIAQNLVIGQGGNFKIMMDGDLFKVSITFKRKN